MGARQTPTEPRALNPLKRLASQTAVYGVSSVLGRFLNYLLVPLLTYAFAPAEYGVVAELYAYMGFLAVLLAFGMETGNFSWVGHSLTDAPSHNSRFRFLLCAGNI